MILDSILESTIPSNWPEIETTMVAVIDVPETMPVTETMPSFFAVNNPAMSMAAREVSESKYVIPEIVATDGILVMEICDLPDNTTIAEGFADNVIPVICGFILNRFVNILSM